MMEAWLVREAKTLLSHLYKQSVVSGQLELKSVLRLTRDQKSIANLCCDGTVSAVTWG